MEQDLPRAVDIFDTWCIRDHARSCVRLGHLLREGKVADKGILRMESVDYDAFLQNRFGRYYA